MSIEIEERRFFNANMAYFFCCIYKRGILCHLPFPLWQSIDYFWSCEFSSTFLIFRKLTLVLPSLMKMELRRLDRRLWAQRPTSSTPSRTSLCLLFYLWAQCNIYLSQSLSSKTCLTKLKVLRHSFFDLTFKIFKVL